MAEKLAAFITTGGYNGPDCNSSGSIEQDRGNRRASGSAPGNGGRFSARNFSATRQLTIKIPSGGVITILDLNGRQLIEKNIGQPQYKKNDLVQLPVRFGAGMYIVRFRGLTGAGKQVMIRVF
jgi:hypothetical protein